MAVIYQSLTELEASTTPLLSQPDNASTTLIDDLIFTAEFAENDAVKEKAITLIYDMATAGGINSSSLLPLYSAFGQGSVEGFTVPALNIRTLTYDVARLIFRLIKRYEIGVVIFELSRTEIEYTHQRPAEYAAALFAAAIKEHYKGPIFIQGDHYQFNQKHFIENKNAEIDRLKALIKESLEAAYVNIDIDASTLVDLSKTSLMDQQKDNSEMTALLTTYIRSLEQDTALSIGGEIGHIGDRNSTAEDFEAFMSGYLPLIQGEGISKVSVQTGTSHGGTPLSDGSLKEVALDFSVLKTISTLAREKYHLGGAVQHGASTLPLSSFDHFVENKTLEIHLATGLQNIIFDQMSEDVRNEMYVWVKENLSQERQPDWNDYQFLYKTRKKALGPFKEVLWSMSDNEKTPIITSLEKQFTLIFDKLKLFNTRKKVMPFFS